MKLFYEDKKASLTENIADFHNILSQVNQNSVLFSNTQINDITETIFNTFFQHYKLYEFMASESQQEYVIFKEVRLLNSLRKIYHELI